MFHGATGLRPLCLLALLYGAWMSGGSSQAAGINLPAAGVNATSYSYFTTALPFVDVAHMGDGWRSAMAGVPAADAREIPLTEDGYPSSLLSGEMARSLVFLGNGGIYPTGLYTLGWTGNGDVQVSGNGLTVVNRQPNQITYKVQSTDPGGLSLDITRTDPANPVRNIVLRAPFPGANGSAFSPIYKSDLANYGVVRYMGWNMVNNSKISQWSERVDGNDFHWGSVKGVSYEMQIALSNEIKEDLWLTVPHLADDNYVRNLADMVSQKLAPGLRVWVEYSNEVWNGGFAQFHYANNVLQPRYGVANFAQAYGRRASEIFDIFSSKITDPNRLVRVIAGQNANSWILDQALTGATVGGTLKADVAAVAPYFQADVDKLYQQHLAGTVNLDNVFAELRSNIDAIITSAQHNKDVAAARGLPLVAYEGGQHLVARPGAQHNDQAFVDLLININRDPRMGDLYKYMLDKWYAAGGKTFVFVGETAGATKWGTWGLKENYLDDGAAKFRAVQDYLKGLPRNRADFNKDGAVDLHDFDIWQSTIGSALSLSADANRDGLVDMVDYDIWRQESLLLTHGGDFNGDGSVDSADYALWLSTIGSNADLRADANGDGIIDMADYSIWLNNISAGTGSAGLSLMSPGTVPEPCAVILLFEAACLCLLERHWRMLAFLAVR